MVFSVYAGLGAVVVDNFVSREGSALYVMVGKGKGRGGSETKNHTGQTVFTRCDSPSHDLELVLETLFALLLIQHTLILSTLFKLTVHTLYLI